MEMQLGNTRIIFDTSYLDTVSEEQQRIDADMLNDAVWNLYDEFEEAV